MADEQMSRDAAKCAAPWCGDDEMAHIEDSIRSGEFEGATKMFSRQRMQLIEEIRQVVPQFEVTAWDSDIRVQREYPDPLYPETHTMTQTWYIGGREHWQRLRPMIEQSHRKVM